VTAIGPDTVLLAFLAFCRIGGCLMLMPGFSSSRVPVHVRLFIAVALTLALAPLLLPVLRAAAKNTA
jgi:flagellar biosynthesis protein FliR